MNTRFCLLPVAICSLMLGACSSDDPVVEPEGVLTWRSCPEDASLDCATLRVPMNYSNLLPGPCCSIPADREPLASRFWKS